MNKASAVVKPAASQPLMKARAQGAQSSAASLLALQRTHGNSFVQQLLSGSGVMLMPRAGSAPIITDTNYAFDTYQITESHLDDPEIIARLNALSTPQLEDYRRRVKDLAVIWYITRLIESRPPEYTPELPGGGTTFKWLDLNVVILPDYYSLKPLPRGDAVTTTNFEKQFLYNLENGKVKDPELVLTLYIQTVYGPGSTSQSKSGYGVGTRKQDKTPREKSLGFHERTHSQTIISYIKLNKLPQFDATDGMTWDEFLAAIKTYNEKMREYHTRMKENSVFVVDCTGEWADFCPGMSGAGKIP